MQDFTIKTKNKKQTKRKVVRKIKKRSSFMMQYAVLSLVVVLAMSIVGSYVSRKDNGLLWKYGQGSAKNAVQEYFEPKELLSIINNEKSSVGGKIHGKEGVSSTSGSYYRELIKKYFPEKPHIMIAIAKEESQLDPNAVNYNCRYKISTKGATRTTVYDSLTHTYIDLAVVSKERLKGYVSTWCRPGHSVYAWSKDSGLFGINSVHTTEKLSPEEQVKLARAIYEKYGLDAWVSYKTGRYLKHL